jgi:hypothetical protein
MTAAPRGPNFHRWRRGGQALLGGPAIAMSYDDLKSAVFGCWERSDRWPSSGFDCEHSGGA